MPKPQRQKLMREANRLTREVYDAGVTEERIEAIYVRLAEIDRAIYG